MDSGAVIDSFERALERARLLADLPGRTILGIAGPPAAGKSTLAHALTTSLGTRAAHVPMDGFHLADVTLERLGRLDAKGAPDTFDVEGYAALLERLHDESDRTGEPGVTIYAPAFERDLEQPIAGALAVPPEAELIITEGNYLLIDGPGWQRARRRLDEVWYCQSQPANREAWLLARHLRFGKSADQAREWMQRVDQSNASLIEAHADRADVMVAPSTIAELTTGEDMPRPQE